MRILHITKEQLLRTYQSIYLQVTKFYTTYNITKNPLRAVSVQFCAVIIIKLHAYFLDLQSVFQKRAVVQLFLRKKDSKIMKLCFSIAKA